MYIFSREGRFSDHAAMSENSVLLVILKTEFGICFPGKSAVILCRFGYFPSSDLLSYKPGPLTLAPRAPVAEHTV